MLLSDGASRFEDLFELATWEELQALLDENGPTSFCGRSAPPRPPTPRADSGPGPSATTTLPPRTWSCPDG
jgi:hypothetical protein